MSTDQRLFRFGGDDSDGILFDEYIQESDVKDIRSVTRPSGACVDCKSVKVRCEFVPGERKCGRCQAKGLPCTPRERKKRKPADTHEQLQEKAHEKDIQIQSLLRQFDQLRTEQKIRHWVEKAHDPEQGQQTGPQILKWDYKGKSPESAAISFFRAPRNASPPLIIKYCSLYPEEIQDLFSLYFERINPFFSLLDPELHTAENLIWSCPFLFTVMCAVASRYYVARRDVYPLAMDFARDIAGQVLVNGSQSIDVCQAYLIMAVYPTPRKKWAEDRSWLLMGVAIRMAMELGLNQPPFERSDRGQEQQSLNRVRTWLNCYCVDGSHAIQFGKMPMVRLDDYLARTSQIWYRSSSMNSAFDVHLCAYVQILTIMAQWRNLLNSFDKGHPPENFDIIAISLQTEQRLTQELDAWVTAYKEEYTHNPLPICNYRSNTTQLITAYLRLVVLATAFQHGLKRGLSRQSDVFVKAFDTAKMVISIMSERLYPTGYLRYAMEANFLYVAYAAAFLTNLLRPKLLPLLDEKQRREILHIVPRLIEILRSRDVALDGRHTPALYSKFLSSLLERYNVKKLPSSSRTSDPNVSFSYQHVSDSTATRPPTTFWPDTSSVNSASPSLVPDYSDGLVFQQSGEAEMDFSLNHFVRTVSQDFPSPFSSTGSMDADIQSLIAPQIPWMSVPQDLQSW